MVISLAFFGQFFTLPSDRKETPKDKCKSPWGREVFRCRGMKRAAFADRDRIALTSVCTVQRHPLLSHGITYRDIVLILFAGKLQKKATFIYSGNNFIPS